MFQEGYMDYEYWGSVPADNFDINAALTNKNNQLVLCRIVCQS